MNNFALVLIGSGLSVVAIIATIFIVQLITKTMYIGLPTVVLPPLVVSVILFAISNRPIIFFCPVFALAMTFVIGFILAWLHRND